MKGVKKRIVVRENKQTSKKTNTWEERQQQLACMGWGNGSVGKWQCGEIKFKFLLPL